jgi:hypothetical protein
MPDNLPQLTTEYGLIGTVVVSLLAGGSWLFKALWWRDEASRTRLMEQLDSERACTAALRERNESLHESLAVERARNDDIQARLLTIERSNANMHAEHREWRIANHGCDSRPSDMEMRLSAMQAELVRAQQDATPDEPPTR